MGKKTAFRVVSTQITALRGTWVPDMIRATFLMLLLSLLAGVAAAQEIFRTTDEHGNVVFTDQPPAGVAEGERIELQQTNTTPATPLPPKTKPEQPAAEAETPGFEVAITAPPNETTIAMGPGNFSVTAGVQPALTGGAMLQLYVGGAPWGEPQQANSWDLTNVFRGAHDLTVAVVDEEGQQLAESEPVRVYVLRPSINSPARRGNN
jgi:hypothetical protein